VTVVFFIYRSSNPTRTVKPTAAKDLSEVATRIGSRTSLVLPDGTHVWLNAGSRITYEKNYGIDSREVNLTGEALFDVAHNASMPFVIHAARVDIKVLGTRFNLKSYPTDKTTETTLLKGSIEVSIKARPNEKIILKPNEKLVIANDDSALHRNVSYATRARISEPLVAIRKPTYESATGANIETAWVDDRLAFQDEEFAALAKEMERWYGVQIAFTQPTQETWRFTGSFQKETVQQALEALKLTAPFTYTIHENQITIYEK
jgi:ferric-dicitrate binding protein FerR (iron transport regulator)